MFRNCCCWCCRGPTGATGSTGPAGPRGATGPTGATGTSSVNVYGGRYNNAAQTLTLQAGVPTVVSFNTAMPSQNISSNDASITVNKSGNYEISYKLKGSASTEQVVSLDIRSNGTAIEGANETHVFSNTETLYESSVVTSLPAGASIDLVATSINGAIVVTLSNGVNASIIIKKLGN